MTRFVALLRGINLGSHNKVPMADLKAICAGLGWADVETYIQSGNVVFQAAGTAAALERALEAALESKLDVKTPVLVRSKSEWSRIVDANPFPAEGEREANRLLCGLSKKSLVGGAARALTEKAVAGERVREAGGALWFHYPEGVARSKLTPVSIDRAAGSPVTARNWRTVVKLGEMLAP